jgi:hypothetical protein
MDHQLKPHWFIRLLSWIDTAVEVLLALVIFILAAFLVATLVEVRSVEHFLTSLLFSGRR